MQIFIEDCEEKEKKQDISVLAKRNPDESHEIFLCLLFCLSDEINEAIQLSLSKMIAL